VIVRAPFDLDAAEAGNTLGLPSPRWTASTKIVEIIEVEGRADADARLLNRFKRRSR
jgi:hypothetical protein